MPRAEIDNQELIHILQNSRIGKIRYDTGTGLDPREAQREMEKTHEILCRAAVIMDQTASRERRVVEESRIQEKNLKDTELGQFLEASILAQKKASPQTPLLPARSASNSSIITIESNISTLSLGNSIMSLNSACSMIPPKSLLNLKELSRSRDISDTNSLSSTSLITPARRKGFGIRNDPEDGEYDDEADEIALATQSPLALNAKRLLESLEQKHREKFEQACRFHEEKWRQFNQDQDMKVQKLAEQASKEVQVQQREMTLKWENKILDQERGIDEKRKENELYNQMKDKDLTTQKQLEEERKNLEKERKEAEERAAALIEKEKKLQAEKEAQAKLEERAHQEKAKLEAEEKARLIEAEKVKSSANQSPLDDRRVPEELRGSIFHSDLARYVASQDLLEDIRTRTKHISSSSPQTKKFYLEGTKAVNLPLNQIGEQDVQAKITHFINLLDGKPVQWGGMQTSFVSSAVNEGSLFIMNIFAFRFVKKAEAEVSENKVKNENLNYLAKLGVPIIKRFPILGAIIQAHFYKLCPFLVPFNFPRGNMNIEEYAAAVGLETQGIREEGPIIQVLLARLTGYCTLYGFMVKNLENLPPRASEKEAMEDVCSFFSSGEVWSILQKTTVLVPQIEVTATMVHGLLEVMSDCLRRRYMSQFRKAMLYIKTHFIPKVRQCTPPGKGASLARLELFLEKNVR